MEIPALVRALAGMVKRASEDDAAILFQAIVQLRRYEMVLYERIDKALP
jgi:hypothetical protein